MEAVPHRIRLSRRKGWRKPEGAIVVARPSRWGNPHAVGSEDPRARRRLLTRVDAVELYRADLQHGRLRFSRDDARSQLRGHDLACWCPLDDEHGERVPCHADVLLEIANA